MRKKKSFRNMRFLGGTEENAVPRQEGKSKSFKQAMFVYASALQSHTER